MIYSNKKFSERQMKSDCDYDKKNQCILFYELKEIFKS